MNTNDNKRKYNNTLVEIEGSETPIKHAVSVWKQYVSKVVNSTFLNQGFSEI